MKRTLCLAGMLVTLAGGGCATVQPIAPDPTNATLVPGTQGCRLVVRGDTAVWWTAEYGADLTESDRAVDEKPSHVGVPLRYTATDLAAGFGSVWIASGGGRPTIQKFDQQTNRLVASIELASLWGTKGRRTFVAAGEGAVWATVNVLDSVFRVDPHTGTITDTIAVGPISASDKLGRVAAGEGAVWVLHNRTVSRIDPVSRQVVARIAVPGLVLGVGEILAAGGAVWVAAGSTVMRIDPRTDAIAATIATVLDSAVPANRFAVGHMVLAGGTLRALAFRTSGSFMEPTSGRYALVEIDPGSNSVRSTRQLGTGDASSLFFGPTLAATDAAIWVSQPTGLYLVPPSSARRPGANAARSLS